jgi:hypothetical protein
MRRSHTKLAARHGRLVGRAIVQELPIIGHDIGGRQNCTVTSYPSKQPLELNLRLHGAVTNLHYVAYKQRGLIPCLNLTVSERLR